jgi:hypothetical protein
MTTTMRPLSNPFGGRNDRVSMNGIYKIIKKPVLQNWFFCEWENKSENAIIFISYDIIIDFYNLSIFVHLTRDMRRFFYHDISDVEKFLFF